MFSIPSVTIICRIGFRNSTKWIWCWNLTITIRQLFFYYKWHPQFFFWHTLNKTVWVLPGSMLSNCLHSGLNKLYISDRGFPLHLTVEISVSAKVTSNTLVNVVGSTVAITDCSTMTTSHSSGSILIVQSVLGSTEFFFVKPENHYVAMVIYML